MGEAESFIWYALMTTDATAAKAFDRTVVGWEMRGFGGVGPRTS